MLVYKEWDSKILNMKTAELVVKDMNSLFVDFNRFEYITTRISVDKIDYIRTLETLGFRTVDIFVKYRRYIGDYIKDLYHPYFSKNSNLLRFATIDDLDLILKTFLSSFYMDRFHNDPSIDRGVADNIYKQWITNLVTKQYGDGVLLADNGVRLLGFMGYKMLDKESASIELTATLPFSFIEEGYTKISISDLLLNFIINDLYSKGIKLLTTGTQAYNIPSRRMLERNLFVESNIYITLSKRN